MLPDQKLDALVARHAALERDLTAAMPRETYVKLSREFAELSPVVEAVNSYRTAQRELEGVTSLIDDPATDAEMRAIADAERRQLETRRAELEQQLRSALIPKDAMDERNVILEIRAGTGGDEAALFAGDLFRKMCIRDRCRAGTHRRSAPSARRRRSPCILRAAPRLA